jgi:hypothetical protein
VPALIEWIPPERYAYWWRLPVGINAQEFHRLGQKPCLMCPFAQKRRGLAGVNSAAVRLGLVVLSLILLWSAIIAVVVIAYRALS